MAELEQWVREMAPTLDDLDWGNLEASEDLDTFDEWELTSERHAALLEHVREQAAGLKPTQRECLAACVRDDMVTLSPGAVAFLTGEGLLVTGESYAGCSVHSATAFGRAVLRVLEAKHA